MKNILTVILFCAGFVLNGQTINADKVNIKTNLKLNNVTVNSISNDTTLGSGSSTILPTEKAVKGHFDYVIDKDTILGTSKTKVPSQYAVKKYVDENGGGSAAGSSGQVQYNNSGAFGALDSFTVSANPDRVGIGVPTPTARLDIQGSGATSATKALRIRNSTGTDLFAVRNDGQLQVNSNTEASKSSLLLSGTGFSGGTATTTKPTLLIEPTGTTSTGWVTSGTKLGVNAESGFTGLLMDLELNGTTQFSVSSGGSLNLKGGISAPTGAITSGSDIVSGGYFGVTSKSWIRSATNGNWTLYNNATTDFGLLQFGGTTSSYPALKRNSTGLDVRLADDSGYTAIQTLYDRFGSGSPESVVTAPVGAVYHRTDGGAGTSLYVKESGTGNTGWVAK